MSLLKEKNVDFIIIEYLKTPITEDEVILLSQKLGRAPAEFVRCSERDFKENQLHRFLSNDKKMAECMVKFPKIIERPIFVNGNRAVIGRPPEDILMLLD